MSQFYLKTLQRFQWVFVLFHLNIYWRVIISEYLDVNQQYFMGKHTLSLNKDKPTNVVRPKQKPWQTTIAFIVVPFQYK